MTVWTFLDDRNPARVTHTLADMIRARIFRHPLRLRGLQRSRHTAQGPRLQTRLRQVARQRRRLVFAADAVAAGECAVVEECDPPHLRARRSMLALPVDDRADRGHVVAWQMLRRLSPSAMRSHNVSAVSWLKLLGRAITPLRVVRADLNGGNVKPGSGRPRLRDCRCA